MAFLRMRYESSLGDTYTRHHQIGGPGPMADEKDDAKGECETVEKPRSASIYTDELVVYAVEWIEGKPEKNESFFTFRVECVDCGGGGSLSLFSFFDKKKREKTKI